MPTYVNLQLDDGNREKLTEIERERGRERERERETKRESERERDFFAN